MRNWMSVLFCGLAIPISLFMRLGNVAFSEIWSNAYEEPRVKPPMRWLFSTLPVFASLLVFFYSAHVKRRFEQDFEEGQRNWRWPTRHRFTDLSSETVGIMWLVRLKSMVRTACLWATNSLYTPHTLGYQIFTARSCPADATSTPDHDTLSTAAACDPKPMQRVA